MQCHHLSGIIAVVVLALSQLLCWYFCPHFASLVALIMLVSLLSLRWHHHPHPAGVSTIIELSMCCQCYQTGIFAVVALALLP
jgi:hypothetical protein